MKNVHISLLSGLGMLWVIMAFLGVTVGFLKKTIKPPPKNDSQKLEYLKSEQDKLTDTTHQKQENLPDVREQQKRLMEEHRQKLKDAQNLRL